MTTFRMKDDGRLISEQEYREMYPDTLFPFVFVPEDADIIQPVNPPVAGMFQRITETEPVLIDEVWMQAWETEELSVDEQTTVLNARITAGIKRIDYDVDQIISTCIGSRATEYMRAEAQARAFKAADYTGVAGNSITSHATAKVWTTTQAADDIIAQANAWIGAEDVIRLNRLVIKEAYRNATTEAQLNTATAIWSDFVTAIRTSLGI